MTTDIETPTKKLPKNVKFKALSYSALVLISLVLIAIGYQAYQPKFVRAEGCVNWNPIKNICQQTIELNIEKKISSGYHYIFNGYLWRFSLHFEMKNYAFLSDTYGSSQIGLEVASSPIEERFEHTKNIYARGVNLPVTRIETDELIAISESERGFAGWDFLIRRDGKKDVWFRCAKPFTAYAGNLVNDVGCRVSYYMQPGIVIEYGIRRDQLHQWNELNALVVTKVNASIFHQQTNLRK